MATIKITDENGKQITLNQFKVNDINIVQTVGDGEQKVMSQKAVTEELKNCARLVASDKDENAYTFSESIIIDCGEF